MSSRMSGRSMVLVLVVTPLYCPTFAHHAKPDSFVKLLNMAHGNRDSLFTTHSPTNRGDSSHDHPFRRDENHADSSSKFSYHSDRDFSPFQQRYSGKEPPEDTEKQFEYIDMVEQTDTTSTTSRQQAPRRKAGLKRKLHRLRRNNVPLVTPPPTPPPKTVRSAKNSTCGFRGRGCRFYSWRW